MKALIIDHVSEYIGESVEAFGIKVDYSMLPGKEKLKERIGDYELLIMRVDPVIDKEILDAAKKLKSIHVCSVGTNHIDLSYAKEKGIQVTNAPGVNSNAVAELAIGKMIDLFRMTVPAGNEVAYGRNWNKYKWVGWELKGKTLGIVGCGKTGSRLAKLSKALEMEVLAYDPYLKKEEIEKTGAKCVTDLETIMKNSRCVSLHVPLTDETRDMISYPQFDQMKKGSYLVNCARGSVVNEQAAYENLRLGKLAGYAADVLATEIGMGGFSREDISMSSPLFEFQNFICTPHIGGSTHDAMDAIGRIVVGKIADIYGFKMQAQ